MKKSVIFACTAVIAVTSAPATADMLGAKVGIDYVYSDLKVDGSTVNKHQDNVHAYAAFEHFIPLVPNGLVEYSTYGTSAVGFERLAATAYYQLLDNDLVALDFGAGMSRYSDIEVNTKLDGQNTPHAYMAGEVMLPITNFSLFADAKAFGLQDVKGEEVSLGVRWALDLPIELGARVGYSMTNLTFDNALAGKDVKFESAGWMLGVDARF